MENKINKIQAVINSLRQDEAGLLTPEASKYGDVYNSYQVSIKQCLARLDDALEIIKELQDDVSYWQNSRQDWAKKAKFLQESIERLYREL